MGRMGSTTSVRARQMRRELARWQRSGLKLREYGQQHGIPLSTLSWWRQVFRRAGEQGNAASKQSRRAMWWCSPKCRSRRMFQGHHRCGDRPAQRASGAGAGGSRYRHAAAGAPGPADDMLTLPASVRVFVARGATDLRRSFDRLSAQVQEVLRQDPLSGHVFVFFNRQRNRVKLLVWERDGFWLLYKRLEAGTFAVLDRDEINARELYLLLEGIEVIRERRRYTRLAVSESRYSVRCSYSTYTVVIRAAGGGGTWRRQAAQRLKQSSTNSATRSIGSTKRTRRYASGCSC